MNQDEEHLKLLAIFHYVLAGMAAFFALFPVIHLVLGIVLVAAPEKFGAGREAPPPFLGWLFISVAGFLIVLGWLFALLMLLAGRRIARRRHHLFCLLVAGLECLFVPFGTVLGVFTLIVLSRDSVKERFAVSAPGR